MTLHDTQPAARRGTESPRRGAAWPRVYLHIGEPKTGTTFLQHNLWANRALLAARGVMLPGYWQRDHFRASRDLRGVPKETSDPEPSWHGEWEVLAGQAVRVPKAAVISDEILAACNPPQAERAVLSLLPAAEVHVVLTVRGFASMLPAEWQETIKCGKTASWGEWLDSVIEAAPVPARRKLQWFWAAHDTMAILAMWSRHISPDHIHVITLPRSGQPTVLWERFMSVLGADPSGMDLGNSPANASLGAAEAEFLRRLNLALPDNLPDWFYRKSIKRMLAPDVLGARPHGTAFPLTGTQEAWAVRQSEILVKSLRDSKYHIVGDLDELLVRPASALPSGRPAPTAEQMLDAGVDAAAALTHRLYLAGHGATQPKQRTASPRGALRLAVAMVGGSRVKRVLANQSQHASVRRLRIAIWYVLTRSLRRP